MFWRANHKPTLKSSLLSKYHHTCLLLMISRKGCWHDVTLPGGYWHAKWGGPVSARFAPFPPNRFFISARPSACPEWIRCHPEAEGAKEQKKCVKPHLNLADADLKLDSLVFWSHEFVGMNSQQPCHHQSCRPTLPWPKMHSRSVDLNPSNVLGRLKRCRHLWAPISTG